MIMALLRPPREVGASVGERQAFKSAGTPGRDPDALMANEIGGASPSPRDYFFGQQGVLTVLIQTVLNLIWTVGIIIAGSAG